MNINQGTLLSFAKESIKHALRYFKLSGVHSFQIRHFGLHCIVRPPEVVGYAIVQNLEGEDFKLLHSFDVERSNFAFISFNSSFGFHVFEFSDEAQSVLEALTEVREGEFEIIELMD